MGGVWSYEELLAILANLTQPEHAERIDWIGQEFNPDDFDLQHGQHRARRPVHQK
ncbi:plasmid pRiA4b ORF-3 family protein [Mesorhizobium sp. M1050]|uniref:IS1096 element passenger TnpR family protein n=1 Tax=unclassified Mesorhizobium TaxID=325217 RepID=UPI00333C1971